MIWLTWRQHRKQALFTAAALAALAAFVVPTGLAMRNALTDAGLQACLGDATESASMACNRAFDAFANRFDTLMTLGVLFLVLPLLVGLFWGAPLIAREVEHGTHRLVWTQGVSRRRWALVKIALVGTATLAAAAAYGLGLSWWFGPANQIARQGRFEIGLFDMQGVVPIGYTLFAVALGIAAGTVWPRMLPAMAVTLVGFVGVRFAITGLARPRFIPAETRTFPVMASEPLAEPSGDWVLAVGVRDASGEMVLPDARVMCPPGVEAPGGGPCGADLGLGPGSYNWQLYQPGSRFWAFQYIEAGIYVALAALLLYLAVRRIRRIA